MSQPIRIAISGGGLAGASLIQALLKFPHLDVHIFESATAFKESGMAIGIARNALAALDLIGPSATQCLERAGAVPMRGVRFMLAQGEGRGNLIDEADDKAQGKRITSIVHRANFLQELLADVPEERMHASKKLDKTERTKDGSIIIHFTDGSTHECDILVGADGIHSTVRKLILGKNDPAASPRNTGTWIVMTLQPYARALTSLGEGSVDLADAREYSWIGDGSFILHNLLSDGQLVQFVIASHDKEAESSDKWNRVVKVEEIKKLYKDWPPHLNKAVNELLCDQPEQHGIYLWEHPPASTYVSGPICVIGDAAHATTPWQGSGGGMSIEDSLILSSLLGRVKTSTEAQKALKVYDQVRRPRTQRIVVSSRGTGVIMRGRGEETGLDIGKLREKLLPRWDFIIDFDNEKHLNEAIEILKVELKGEEMT
ncbi:FAD/NAD(P)-binding domain-containing protein [Annulohypoxylon truncatum]|uniref:FAD/NAD(P)-binding domain-containing protein n=1 Tax=Annulohypoxylon truncatum TaxID=327061 RepID=UPI0020085F88|nr:FAD/NAD(P)-binding domain-containing protein [Annulohypoxylon truncatum]KAI1204068.1 FAD/NAD(P)-binding domain-containing protein [Annulohypoxylon truncatum]